MSKQSIESFKQFVKNHPGLIHEVRKGKRNWQELYEEWYILGDEDEIWKPYRKNDIDNHTDPLPTLFSKIMEKMKQVDFNEVEKNIVQVNSVIDNIQQLLREFRPKDQIDRFPSHYPYHPHYWQY